MPYTGYNPYLLEEDCKILDFIVDQEAYEDLHSIAFWKCAAEELGGKRTFHSLHEHFRYVIFEFFCVCSNVLNELQAHPLAVPPLGKIQVETRRS